MTAAATVRALRPADIPVLVGVLARAYQSAQNFEFRLRAYLQMRSVATFVAESDGVAVGMVVGNDYGSRAYISQMAVDPPRQRRGIGSALMDGLIAWVDNKGFTAVELDATPAGAPLYARYGFVATGETLVFSTVYGGGHVGAARSYVASDCGALLAADARAFGADRSDVLRLLLAAPQNAVVVCGRPGFVGGYAVAQAEPALLGPLVAPGPAAAAHLFDAARARLSMPHRVVIPSENRTMAAMVAARGYSTSRALAHMIRGGAPVPDRRDVYARINLGQG